MVNVANERPVVGWVKYDQLTKASDEDADVYEKEFQEVDFSKEIIAEKKKEKRHRRRLNKAGLEDAKKNILSGKRVRKKKVITSV